MRQTGNPGISVVAETTWYQTKYGRKTHTLVYYLVPVGGRWGSQESELRYLCSTNVEMLREPAGLFGKAVDTVNTAKDIAYVIWNVGWR
jgi:hypothetical protein